MEKALPRKSRHKEEILSFGAGDADTSKSSRLLDSRKIGPTAFAGALARNPDLTSMPNAKAGVRTRREPRYPVSFLFTPAA
jgi:hypothetical protein